MAWESIEVEARNLVDTVNNLFHEGSVRRIRLRQGEHILFEIPLNYGVGIGAVAVMVAPVLAAVGAVAAIVSHCTLEIERVDEPNGTDQATATTPNAPTTHAPVDTPPTSNG